ncbi:MAG: hypothetical protein AAFV53_17580 [Myxococcota bacterium]
MSLSIPNHQILEPLRESKDRVVLRVRCDGVACVTRVILRPVPMQLEGLIEGVVTSGTGSLAGLDDEVIATLEGYRVRCRLNDAPGLPDVYAAGLAKDPTRCPDRMGLPFVTTRWIPGKTIAHLPHDTPVREAILRDILQILQRLHDRNFIYGDLKPQNVIFGPDGVHLIDLDTLREASGPLHPIQVTHRTPKYAAPEQNARPPLSYPASDVYTFGLMACELLGGVRVGEPGFPPRLSKPWDAVVDACFRHRPGARPQARDLLRRLDGQIDALPTWSGEDLHAGTEPVHTVPVTDHGPIAPRSPAPGETISVDAPTTHPTAAPEVPLPSPLPPSGASNKALKPGRRRRQILIALAVLALSVSAVGVGLGVIWTQRWQAAAEQADALFDALRDHKTVPEKNNEETLDALIARIDEVVADAQTPELLGIRALAGIWKQRWHFQGTTWDEERFSKGQALVRAANQARETPASLLARGVLHSGACRKMPDAMAIERRKFCHSAIDNLERASRRMKMNSDLRWLEVEVLWASVMTSSALARHNEERGDEDGARAVRLAAMRQCQDARSKLSLAPVNGPELLQDCLVVIGPLYQYDVYLAFADLLLEARSTRRSRELVVRSVHPDCGGVRFSNGQPQATSDGEGDAQDLCVYLGLVAMGCPGRARASRECWRYSTPLLNIGERRCRQFAEETGVPWSQALAAARRAPREQCLLD